MTDPEEVYHYPSLEELFQKGISGPRTMQVRQGKDGNESGVESVKMLKI